MFHSRSDTYIFLFLYIKDFKTGRNSSITIFLFKKNHKKKMFKQPFLYLYFIHLAAQFDFYPVLMPVSRSKACDTLLRDLSWWITQWRRWITQLIFVPIKQRLLLFVVQFLKVLKYGINGKPPSCCGTLREINWVDQAVTATACGLSR